MKQIMESIRYESDDSPLIETDVCIVSSLDRANEHAIRRVRGQAQMRSEGGSRTFRYLCICLSRCLNSVGRVELGEPRDREVFATLFVSIRWQGCGRFAPSLLILVSPTRAPDILLSEVLPHRLPCQEAHRGTRAPHSYPTTQHDHASRSKSVRQKIT